MLEQSTLTFFLLKKKHKWNQRTWRGKRYKYRS